MLKSKTIIKAQLYGILDTGYIKPKDCQAITQELIDGGVDIIQLRAKNLPQSEIKKIATKIHPIIHNSQAPLIINDYPKLAAQVGAEGTHLGQDDGDIKQAKQTLGDDTPIIGRSTHNIGQALKAATLDKASYIGFGPLFATPTKPGRTPIGLQNIKKIHSLIKIPIFCIGGINRETIESVLLAGAKRIVVVSALLKAKNIAQEANFYKTLLKKNHP